MRSFPNLLAAAVALAGSVYVRPIGYFLPLVIAIGLAVWIVSSRPNERRLLGEVAVFLVLSIGLTGLWQLRNRVETGYTGFSAISGINAYFYLGASVLAAEQHVAFYEMQRRLGYDDQSVYLQQHPLQKNWPMAERLNYMEREGIHTVVSSPLTYAKIHLEGILRIILDSGSTGALKLFRLYPEQGGLLGTLVDQGFLKTMKMLIVTRPIVFWSNAVLTLLELIYFAFAAVTALSRRVTRDPAVLAVMLIATYFLVISGGPAANDRFRHPVMPLLCVLSGYSLCVLTGRHWRARSGPLSDSAS